ncbi:MAG: response regulator with CheY-like receiver, AAA-type ATPase, and DNA-binding domain [Ignavibacteria bacterium]|nr:response regulator with CheY-like receiver, AAA-type ATPase, and DNA-binding domain [Ignavibacteria bacterium]
MSGNKKILIIDDEQDVVSYFSEFFTDNGFETINAKNGKEGFDKALTDSPAIITLDITMPEESGVRAFKDLQENEKTKNIPVIIVTGISKDFKNFISSRKHLNPPIAYFEKPVNMHQLLLKINEILK